MSCQPTTLADYDDGWPDADDHDSVLLVEARPRPDTEPVEFADLFPALEFPEDDPEPRIDRPHGRPGLDAFDADCEFPAAVVESEAEDEQDLAEPTLFEFPSPWWHDESVLDELYNERDLPLEAIAEDVFGDAVSRETIRQWIERHDLKEDQTLAQQLTKANPEDVGLDPIETEQDPKYNRRRVRA